MKIKTRSHLKNQFYCQPELVEGQFSGKIASGYKIFPSLVGLIVLICFSSCDDSSTPAPEELQIARLSKTWSISSVTLDGFDVTTPTYQNFVMLFRKDKSWWVPSEKTPAFTESGGFWEFNKDDLNQIIINEVPVTLEFSNEDNALKLNFSAPGTSLGEGSRSKGLKGQYEFKLNLSANQITE
jgi:hypothetical protein